MPDRDISPERLSQPFPPESGATSTRVGLTRGLAALLFAGACGVDRGGIGAPCASSTADCAETARAACVVAWPGGYCTEIDCQLGSCPDGARCVTGISFPNVELDAFCLASCTVSSDCRAGYRCASAGTADKVCAPAP